MKSLNTINASCVPSSEGKPKPWWSPLPGPLGGAVSPGLPGVRWTRRDLDLQSLVAFSGEVPDPDVEVLHDADRPTVTEASENPGLHGRDLATVFNQAGQHVLIVANKYQTGFDQPLLVAMYVDKQLSGIAAVQTLSRLNRRAPGKDKTFVLDFVNDPEQIRDAFLQYYEDALRWRPNRIRNSSQIFARH